MSQALAQETEETPIAEQLPIAAQILTADVEIGDDDSAIGDELDINTTSSIASSIYKFRVENGRTYNAYGDRTYMMPNDEIEQDRLDLQHHLFQMTFGNKLFTLSINATKVQRVLDVGTGTGIWAIDYADSHPQAEVIGVDVSPIQPSFVPPNLHFQIDDIEKEWTFTRKFDFIFSRMMTGAISNWTAYIQQCFDHTGPGGYLEVQDICTPPQCIDESAKGTSLEEWGILMLDSSYKLEIPLDSVKSVKKIMEDIGYVDVAETVYQWPLNRWPAGKEMKEIGAWAHAATVANLDGLTMALFTRGLDWSPEMVNTFLVDVRKDMKNSRIHSYWPIHVLTGRKPEA